MILVAIFASTILLFYNYDLNDILLLVHDKSDSDRSPRFVKSIVTDNGNTLEYEMPLLPNSVPISQPDHGSNVMLALAQHSKRYAVLNITYEGKSRKHDLYLYTHEGDLLSDIMLPESTVDVRSVAISPSGRVVVCETLEGHHPARSKTKIHIYSEMNGEWVDKEKLVQKQIPTHLSRPQVVNDQTLLALDQTADKVITDSPSYQLVCINIDDFTSKTLKALTQQYLIDKINKGKDQNIFVQEFKATHSIDKMYFGIRCVPRKSGNYQNEPPQGIYELNLNKNSFHQVSDWGCTFLLDSSKSTVDVMAIKQNFAHSSIKFIQSSKVIADDIQGQLLCAIDVDQDALYYVAAESGEKVYHIQTDEVTTTKIYRTSISKLSSR